MLCITLVSFQGEQATAQTLPTVRGMIDDFSSIGSATTGQTVKGTKDSYNGFITLKVAKVVGEGGSGSSISLGKNIVFTSKRGPTIFQPDGDEAGMGFTFSRPVTNLKWTGTESDGGGSKRWKYLPSFDNKVRGVVEWFPEITYVFGSVETYSVCTTCSVETNKITLKNLSYDFGPNTFSYTTNPVLTATIDLKYAFTKPSETLPYRSAIRDVDTGTITWKLIGDRDIGAVGSETVEADDQSPYDNNKTQDFTFEFKGAVNGPPTQTLSITSDQNNAGVNDTFTYTIREAHAPGYVWQDLKAWYKPNLGVETFDVVTNQLEDAQDGSSVSKWTDYAGNEYNLSPPSFSDQPVFKEDVINFNNAIYFDGKRKLKFDDKKLDLSGVAITDLVLFIVYQPDEATTGAVFGLTDGKGNDRGLYKEGNVGGANDGLKKIGALHNPKAPNLATISYKEGALNGSFTRVNGKLVNFFSSTTVGGFLNDLSIGNSGNDDSPFKGHIAEIVIYNREKTLEEIQKIETYFAIKYGMSLPFNYVDPEDNIIWKEFIDFGNNVMALGSNSLEKLTQQQTTSAEEGSLFEMKLSSTPMDKSYLVIGHDNTPIYFAPKNIRKELVKLNRTWRANATNNPGRVDLTFDITDPRVTSKITKEFVNDWILVVHNNQDFTTGSREYKGIVNDPAIGGDGRVKFSNVEINNDEYFTVAADVIYIAGSVYTDKGVTPVGANRKVSLAQNGKFYGSTTTNDQGEYLFTFMGLSADDVMTVFPDDQFGLNGVIMNHLPVDNTSYSGVDIYKDYVILASESSAPLNTNQFNTAKATEVADLDVARFVGFIPNPVSGNPQLQITGGLTLLIKDGTDLVPNNGLDINGNLEIDGTFSGTDNDTYTLTGNFIRNKVTGIFKSGDSNFILDGNNQRIFASNQFFNFEKISSTINTLYFEEGTTQVFNNKMTIKGGGDAARIFIKSIDADGNEAQGKQAYVDPRGPIDLRDNAYLNVTDNVNVSAFVIKPQNSVDEDNNINWFQPFIQFKVDRSSPSENRGGGNGVDCATLTAPDIYPAIDPAILMRAEVSPQAPDEVTCYKVEVELSALTTDPVTGNFRVMPSSTATGNDDDFVNPFRALRFPAYDPSLPLIDPNNLAAKTQSIWIPIIDDNKYEIDETLDLEIQELGTINARVKPKKTHRMTILNNDPQPVIQLELSESSLFEVPSTGQNNTTIITAKTKTNSAVNVNSVVHLKFSGKAELGKDYTVSSEKIIIKGGTISGSIELTVINDVFYELSEDVVIEIETIDDGTEDGEQKVFANIASEDDSPLVVLNLSKEEIREGGTFTRLFATIDGTISEEDVMINILDVGSAKTPDDYVLPSSTLTILEGSARSNDILISAIDDNLSENNESINLSMGLIVNGKVKPNGGTKVLTILDNDSDVKKIQITAVPEQILGDGISTSEILVELYSTDGNRVKISGGKVTLLTDAGSIGMVSDFGNGTYKAELTSELVQVGNIVIANIKGRLNGMNIRDEANVRFSSTLDSDGDGIYDFCECPNPPACADTDRDGIENWNDQDSDNDGINDDVECPQTSIKGDCGCFDSDGDGIDDYLEHNINDFDNDKKPNYLDTNSDNDSLTDLVECDEFNVCPDTDGDLIYDGEDGDDNITDPLMKGGDTDQDTIPDKDECDGSDPCVDTDMDGIPNYFDTDADGDGNSDNIQCPNGICPDCDNDNENDILDVDDDNNGIIDTVEDQILGRRRDYDGDQLPTICDPDDDNDGILDQLECPNPPNCPDTDDDGILDIIDLDSDNDGVSDNFECGSSGQRKCPDADGDGIPNYLDSDSDGDTIPDRIECSGTDDNSCPDADGDGLPNYVDLDSNGNGILDAVEGLSDCDIDGLEAFRDLVEQCPQLIPRVGILTPNGDSNNDFWYIEEIEKFPKNKVTIFNRLGLAIFKMEGYENNNALKRFDGVPNEGAKELPSGTYFFNIELGEGFDNVSGYLMIKK